jgi:transcriptional regulator with XRE-family HTH domain
MLATSQGPTIARRRLSLALRAARDGAGQTQEHVAEALDWSVSKMIRIENGKVKATVTDVRALLDLYGVTDKSQVAELIDLARATRQKSWFSGELREQLPAAYAEYVALEADASALSFFQPVFMPGLLQTPAYAQQMSITPIPEELTPEEREVRVAVRRMRQEHLLQGAQRPKIDAIIDESALRRVAGSPEIMREQMLYLAKLGSDPLITLRIFPFSAGVTMVTSPFIVVEFPAGADADVVYIESAISEPELLTSGGVATFRNAFNQLAEKALPPDESLAFMAEIAAGYRPSA